MSQPAPRSPAPRWRRAGPRDRRTARTAWLLATLAAALTTTVVLAAPALPACILRESTGRPCLTCGTGRGWTALAGGDVAAGVGWNPLFTAGLALALLAGWLAPLWVRAGGPVPARPPRTRTWLGIVLALCAAQWVYGLVRGTAG